MSHSYVAFIDESGNDGRTNYKIRGQSGGSSEFLVITGLLCRAIHGLELVKWRDEINEQIPKKRSREIHFQNLNHSQRIVASNALGKLPVRVLSVIDYKPNIPDGLYEEKNSLYHYMTRYLLERISWFCRDERHKVPEGDGRVAITFSRRGGMNYDDFQDYLRNLRGHHETTVHWPVIDIDLPLSFSST